EHSNVVPGKAASTKGPSVDAHAQVSTGIAIDRQVRVEESLAIGVGSEPWIAAGDDRAAYGSEPEIRIRRPSIRPCRAAVNRESVAGESIRHLGSTRGTERRPAETLGIVPAGHHVMTVRGDSDRGLTSPQKSPPEQPP